MTTKPLRIETAVSKMNMAPRIKEPIDLTLEFRYALVDLLGGPMGRRIAVQLISPRAYSMVKKFIDRKFPIKPGNVLRRFLSGEFTDGIEPVTIPTMQRLDVAKLLRVLDVIESMAEEYDERQRTNEVTENKDDTHSNATRAANAERHHSGVSRTEHGRRGRKARTDHAPAPTGR